jgi:TPP-dependent pyruvate/acetoin dehydrogenase alpha subunit
MKEVTQEAYLKWYEDMLGESLISRLAANIHTNKKVEAFTFIYGQEQYLSRCVLHAWTLIVKDRMITAYRNHCRSTHRNGCRSKRVMAELPTVNQGLFLPKHAQT